MFRHLRTFVPLALLLVLCAQYLPAVASAQDSSELEVERARGQFRRGVELAREERWQEAESAFRRAYAHYPEPIVLFNLAGARVQLGRLLEARTSYRQFLEQATDEQASYREAAEREMATIAERIGTVQIEVSDVEERDLIAIDGDLVTDVDAPVEVDPGEHLVTIQRGTAEVARTTVSVEPGGSEVAHLEIVVPERVVIVEEEATSPWVWVGITAGVLAVAGGVLAAVLIATSSTEPYQGNVPPGVVSLPLR